MCERCFLATYRPLVNTKAGREAIKQYGLPPFIDGSCRREPDFQSRFPSITATCRAGNFAPRLRVGDHVAYLTVKRRYLGSSQAGWCLVAVLRVIQRFPSHEQAARWYAQQNEPLPSNCLVDRNPPRPFEMTNGDPPPRIKKRLAEHHDVGRALKLWDASYQLRIKAWPVFLATQVEYMELDRPGRISVPDMLQIFGRVPSTLNPPEITNGQLHGVVSLASAQAMQSGQSCGHRSTR